MNNWMTEERRQIVQKYVHDMINSFVEDPQGADYHDEYDPLKNEDRLHGNTCTT